MTKLPALTGKTLITALAQARFPLCQRGCVVWGPLSSPARCEASGGVFKICRYCIFSSRGTLRFHYKDL